MNKPSYRYSRYIDSWVPSDTEQSPEALLLKGFEIYKQPFNVTPFYDREKSFGYIKKLVELTDSHHTELGYMYLSRFHDPKALELGQHHLKKGHLSEAPNNDADALKYFAREALFRMSPELYDGVRNAMLWIDSVQRKVLGTKYGSKGDYFRDRRLLPNLPCRVFITEEGITSDPNHFFSFDPYEGWFVTQELKAFYGALHNRNNPYFNPEHMRPVLQLLGTYIEEQPYDPHFDQILKIRNHYGSLKNKPEFSYSVLRGNTLRLGPYYNVLAANGLPILGEYVQKYVDIRHPDHGNPIESKITNFIGVIGTPDGQVDFDFDHQEGKPATITEEDINVSLVLAFGYQTPVYPSIDAAPVRNFSGMETDFLEKRCHPKWLIETNWGKSYASTDFLCGVLAWDINQFDIGSCNSAISREKAQNLITRVSSIADHHPENVARIVNINLAAIDFQDTVIQCGPKDKFIGIKLKDISLQIEGGYFSMHDAAGSEWKNRNDLRFSHPQITKILTDEFNTIAELIPAFERLRQCQAMLHSLHLLRQKGFEPGPSLSTHILEKRAEFEERIERKGPEYAIPLPFFYKPEVK